MYIYAQNITNITGCFSGRYNNRRLNIYIPKTTTTATTFSQKINTLVAGIKNWTYSIANGVTC
jgi:hypothetical protein